MFYFLFLSVSLSPLFQDPELKVTLLEPLFSLIHEQKFYKYLLNEL